MILSERILSYLNERTDRGRPCHQQLANRDHIAPKRNESYQNPHHYVSKPKITKESHDQIRMANHGNRNVSHDSGNAALASDNLQMKR